MGESALAEASPQIEETTDVESLENREGTAADAHQKPPPPQEDESTILEKPHDLKGDNLREKKDKDKDKASEAPLLKSRSSSMRRRRKTSIESHDLPHDLPFSITFLALLVLVVVREIYLFGPLLWASFMRVPFAALGLLPALFLGTLLALLGFYVLLRAIKGITPKTLTIFGVILVILYLASGGASLWFQLAHPSPDVLRTSHLASSACAVIIAFSVLVSLIAYRKHIPMVTGVLKSSAEFLLTRGKGVLLLTALAGFIQGLVYFFPLSVAGVAFGVDCAVPAEAAFKELRKKEAMLEASSLNSHVSINELLSVMRVFSLDAKCQPWAAAFFPDMSSSAVFFALSAFLFLWLLALVAHASSFLSCFMLHASRGSTSLDSGDRKKPKIMSEALVACFSDSFGSLCFSSFLAASLSVGYVAARVFTYFYIPTTWPKYIPPILVTMMLLNFILIQTAISHFLVPGLAVFRASVHATSGHVWNLLFKQIHQTAALELSYLPIHTLLAIPVSLLLVFCGALVSTALVASTSVKLLVPIIVIVVLGPCVQYLVFTGIVHSTVISCFMISCLEGGNERDVEAAPLVEKEEGNGESVDDPLKEEGHAER